MNEKFGNSRKLHLQDSKINYFMLTILYSTIPIGVLIFAISPTFLSIRPAPIGEALLIKPLSGSESISPTILYSKFYLV